MKDKKTECFKGLPSRDRFAKTSISDARKAGREAGRALSRI